MQQTFVRIEKKMKKKKKSSRTFQNVIYLLHMGESTCHRQNL